MKITDQIETTKRSLANKLGRYSDRYSTKTKKWLFLISGLCCAGICLLTMTMPFIRSQYPGRDTTQAMPVVIIPPHEVPLISKEDYHTLQDFVQKMDSLKTVDADTYHQAIKGREGLIDSILFLLKYSSQSLLTK